MGGEEEATAVPLGQAPVTARLLQSRVGEVEVEDITVDSGVEEAVETLLLSRIGGTVAGLAAQMPQNRPVLPMGGGLNPTQPPIAPFGNPLPPVTFGAGAARGNTGSGGDRFDAYNKNPMMNQRRY